MRLERFNSYILNEKNLTPAARKFISDKISKLHDEGYEGDQAVAIAYSHAKKAGYDVPDNPNESASTNEAENSNKTYTFELTEQELALLVECLTSAEVKSEKEGGKFRAREIASLAAGIRKQIKK